MFDALIRELGGRFGLGDKAGPLLQMLLAFITSDKSGGIAGLVEQFKQRGFGDMIASWMGGGAGALPINAQQVASLFGSGSGGGLLGAAGAKLGLGAPALSTALAYALPAVIGKLTPGGKIPAAVPAEVNSFIGDAKGWLGGLVGAGAAAAMGAAASATGAVTGAASAASGAVKGAAATGAAAATAGATAVAGAAKQATQAGATAVAGAATAATAAAESAGGGLMKWLPWIIVGAIALWLAMCSMRKSPEAPKPAAPAATAPAPAKPVEPPPAPKVEPPAPTPAPIAAAPAPAPAATPAMEVDKEPTRLTGVNYPEAVSFFFDSGKFGVEVGAQEKIKKIVEWAIKDPNSKIGLSGYHDKRGDPAANKELAKNRAKSVRELLLASGVPQDRIIMVKPQESTGGSDDKQARRVDVYPAQ